MAKPDYYTIEDTVSFYLINPDTVKRLINDEKIEVPEKKIDIPKDQRWNEKQMASKILQGILGGDDIRTMSRSMQEVVGNNRVSAMRNTRTMTTSAENNGRLDSYKNLQSQGMVLKKEWEATPDERTRKSHIDIDGEEQDIDKVFSNGCMFPGDGKGPGDEVWNCRCSMGAHVVGFRRADGSISVIQGERDRTLHDEQIAAERERRGGDDKEKPATLQHYDETYAEFKAKRESEIENKEPFNEMDKMLNDLIENNEFRHRFPDDDAEILTSILTDGGLKTQFETGDSYGGLYSPSIRQRASHNLFGTDIESMADSQWEKYGYLGSKDITQDRTYELASYGGGMITFDKQALFNRTTLTIGDSLDNAADGRYIMGTMVNNVDSMVAVGRPSMIDEFNRRMLKGIEENGIDDATRVGHEVRSYIELQYHGDVTLADIDSITIRKSIWDEIAQDQNLVNIIQENEITCYYIDNKKLIEYVF